jgi:hypothetical protein
MKTPKIVEICDKLNVSKDTSTNAIVGATWLFFSFLIFIWSVHPC